MTLKVIWRVREERAGRAGPTLTFCLVAQALVIMEEVSQGAERGCGEKWERGRRREGKGGAVRERAEREKTGREHCGTKICRNAR